MERRRHKRVSIKGIAVDASDGIGFLQGTAVDISRCGISVTDFQQRKNGEPLNMTYVVSGEGESFKMTVRPKWSVLQGAGKAVGAEIIDPPWGWTEFVMQVELRARYA